MRILSSLIVLAAVVFGAFTWAGAEGEGPTPEEVQARLEALEMEVGFLRAREAALTQYVIQNEQRAAGLQDVVKRSRAAGFEKNRIPVDSRVILLTGMDQLAASLRRDLPVLTKDDVQRAKKIRVFKKQHKLDAK